MPDGSAREYPKPVTPLEIAQSIGPGLAKDALAARVDGELRDLASPIEKDSPVQIITPKSPEGLEIYRHSSAHLMPLPSKSFSPMRTPASVRPPRRVFSTISAAKKRSPRMIWGKSRRK